MIITISTKEKNHVYTYKLHTKTTADPAIVTRDTYVLFS